MQGRAAGKGCDPQAGEQSFLPIPPRGREGVALLLGSSPSSRPCHVAPCTTLGFPFCPREGVGFHEHGGLVQGWSTSGQRASSLSFLKGHWPLQKSPLVFPQAWGILPSGLSVFCTPCLQLRPPTLGHSPSHSSAQPLRVGPVEFGRTWGAISSPRPMTRTPAKARAAPMPRPRAAPLWGCLLCLRQPTPWLWPSVL